ncbi:MAG: hypothetical protein H7Z18_00025 [Methylophilaceae bacterium]|nr:hypothetical protein [Methylophilaceae bacterium]
MKNKDYTKAMSIEDISKLLPSLFTHLHEQGRLNACCVCMTPMPHKGEYRVMTYLDLGLIGAVCPNCTDGAEWHEDASFLVVPDDVDLRISFIKDLRFVAIELAAEKVGYPLATKPLLCDGPNHTAILFTKDKTYSAFALWQESDPLIVGGWFAKDALALTLSVIAGKTEISFINGFPIITSDDEDLFRELAKGPDL